MHLLLPSFSYSPNSCRPCLDSALESGLTTFPQAVGVILASQVVGRLYHTVGPRRLVAFGLFCVSLSNIPFIFISLDVSQTTIRELMFLRGISMAFAFVPLQAATYANIAKSDTGRASAIFSTQRQASAAVGVAILATLFHSRINHLAGDGEITKEISLQAFHFAFAGSIVISFLGSLFAATFIRDIDAKPTMHPRPKKQKVAAV